MRNLQEQVKKHSVTKNCSALSMFEKKSSSDLKLFENSPPSASDLKSFSRSLEQFFLTVGQNNYGNKIPLYFLFCQGFRLSRNYQFNKKFLLCLSLQVIFEIVFISSIYLLSSLCVIFAIVLKSNFFLFSSLHVVLAKLLSRLFLSLLVIFEIDL